MLFSNDILKTLYLHNTDSAAAICLTEDTNITPKNTNCRDIFTQQYILSAAGVNYQLSNFTVLQEAR